VLLLVTDGVTEATSLADEEFGNERVSAWLESVRDATAPQVLSGLLERVLGFCGGQGASDDLTAVVARRA
jgi:serine phosphatase RsbU (regulator of sigma subunit)